MPSLLLSMGCQCTFREVLDMLHMLRVGGEARTSILAAARTAVEAIDSTLDMRPSCAGVRAPVTPSRAAALLATRGRLPNEDTCVGSPLQGLQGFQRHRPRALWHRD